MAVGTGIECINLKKAKYNRDMKLAKEAAASADTQHIFRADDTHIHSQRVNTASRYTDVPVDDGYTLRDIAGAVGKELAGAISTYRKNKQRERARAPKYITRKVKAKTAFPVSIIGYIVVFSVIAMFLVLGNSRINEATLYASSLENEINDAINKCEMLTAEVNSRNDAASVEDYALNVLGLVKKTDVAKTYVSISGEDKIVVGGRESAEKTAGYATMTLSAGN